MKASVHPWLKFFLPAVAATVILLLAAGRVAGLFTAGDRPLSAPASTDGVARLQAAPARDLARLRERERAELARYAWVDREAGLVRIPVEQAMRLLLSRDPQRLFADGPAETAEGKDRKRSAASVQRATAQARAAEADSRRGAQPPAEPPSDEPPVQVERQHPSLGGPTPPPGEVSP